MFKKRAIAIVLVLGTMLLCPFLRVFMPDVSHALLVEHAARSYGLTYEKVTWLAQGAWDEDHCDYTIYPFLSPLCFPGIPNGHHSWDPDTNAYWRTPSFWWDFGSGLSRATAMFEKARAAKLAMNEKEAYLWLGRSLHILGDAATPAHVLLDTHFLFDSDSYEKWLGKDDRANTRAWIIANPPGKNWVFDYRNLPPWERLAPHFQEELNIASAHYGDRASGEDLWELGPRGEDRTLFRIMFLVAELADNFDSDDVQGESWHGDLGDQVYLMAIREIMFIYLIGGSTAWISYFESQ